VGWAGGNRAYLLRRLFSLNEMRVLAPGNITGRGFLTIGSRRCFATRKAAKRAASRHRKMSDNKTRDARSPHGPLSRDHFCSCRWLRGRKCPRDGSRHGINNLSYARRYGIISKLECVNVTR